MKNLYIVLIQTHTNLGRIIRLISRYKYNHVSLSFNETLEPMYSFGRYKRWNGFKAGFVEESILRFLSKNKDVQLKVYKVPVTEETYKETQRYYKQVEEAHIQYGKRELITIKLPKPLRLKAKGKYICLSFMTHIMQKINILKDEEIEDIQQLEKYLDQKFEYSERTILIKDKEKYQIGNDKYFN